MMYYSLYNNCLPLLIVTSYKIETIHTLFLEDVTFYWVYPVGNTIFDKVAIQYPLNLNTVRERRIQQEDPPALPACKDFNYDIIYARYVVL